MVEKLTDQSLLDPLMESGWARVDGRDAIRKGQRLLDGGAHVRRAELGHE